MTTPEPRTFTVGGVTYHSLDEMPPDLRRKVEFAIADRNKNGVPDIMEDWVMPPAMATQLGIGSTAPARPVGATRAVMPERRRARWVPIMVGGLAIATLAVVIVLLMS